MRNENWDCEPNYPFPLCPKAKCLRLPFYTPHEVWNVSGMSTFARFANRHRGASEPGLPPEPRKWASPAHTGRWKVVLCFIPISNRHPYGQSLTGQLVYSLFLKGAWICYPSFLKRKNRLRYGFHILNRETWPCSVNSILKRSFDSLNIRYFPCIRQAFGSGQAEFLTPKNYTFGTQPKLWT